MKRIIIENIRNISKLDFEMPNKGVHLLTGENGVGKSTLFTCISRLTDTFAFRKGFRTSTGDKFDEYRGSITFEVNGNSVTYTRRDNGKWQPDRRKAGVFEAFGYPSVVYSATNDQRLFVQLMETARTEIIPADPWITKHMNGILNTDKFDQMCTTVVGDLRGKKTNAPESRRRNTAFLVKQPSGKYFTESNFSFGEIVLLNLLNDIKSIPQKSVLLIDEVELALHPSAQIRLVDMLRQLAQEKNLCIILSTHSASVIKNQRHVLLLEDRDEDGIIHVENECPPAKAIGAIGMREDTMPDIVVLLEDTMARSLFDAMFNIYKIKYAPHCSNLDLRTLGIGGFSNVVSFYEDTKNYIFYSNVSVKAMLDKDVEEDIIPYKIYGNEDTISRYNKHLLDIKFLPYTPEVFLCEILKTYKSDLLRKMKADYSNQTLLYSEIDNLDFNAYQAQFPVFVNQKSYNEHIKFRGDFRAKCKKKSEEIVESLSDQLCRGVKEIYCYIFTYGLSKMQDTGALDIRPIMGNIVTRRRA